jgi:cyclohexyl-isocyanide hydratase
MTEHISVDIATFTVASGDPPARQPRLGQKLFPGMHPHRRPEVAMLLYPGMTLLDMIGPQTVLADAANVHLVWKTRDVIVSDNGVGILPTTTFEECPKDLDVLFVGGGPGFEVMRDAECLAFLRDRGSRAKYITSVCTGSLVLGAAGLLHGYEATCHWSAREALAAFGAKPVAARVVVDRNRITGGGVTAGIDLGLTLLSTMLGEPIAKLAQLMMEYDPQPPFHAGTPEGAGPEVLQKMIEWIAPMAVEMQQAVEQASKVALK